MSCLHKLTSLPKLISILQKEKKSGRKIVFTNGCFDILHVGHIRYLQKARSLGDILVIGLNKDSSVRVIKGPSRPINSQENRAEVLSALSCVDHVVLFGESTPLGLIQKIRPDFLVKGGDWKKKEIVGSDVVESYGGKVRSLAFIVGFSTTKMINKAAN